MKPVYELTVLVTFMPLNTITPYHKLLQLLLVAPRTTPRWHHYTSQAPHGTQWPNKTIKRSVVKLSRICIRP